MSTALSSMASSSMASSSMASPRASSSMASSSASTSMTSSSSASRPFSRPWAPSSTSSASAASGSSWWPAEWDLLDLWDAAVDAVDWDAWRTANGGFLGVVVAAAANILHVLCALLRSADVAPFSNGKMEAVLVLLAAINGAVLFYANRRRYQLFARANAPAIAAGDMAPSRNARHIRLDATTPMSWMARLRSWMFPPESATLAWELSVWNPAAFCRQLFLFYSPAQALVLVFGSLPWSLVPAIAVAATLWWLDDEYAAQAEDRQLIFHEVYDIQLASSDHRRPVNVRFPPTSPAAWSPPPARSPDRVVLTSPATSPSSTAQSPTTLRPRVDLSRSRGDGSTATTRERRRTQASGTTGSMGIIGT